MMMMISVCRTVSEIFSVKEWRHLETRGRGRSRSFKMAPFDRSYDFLLVGHCKYICMLYHFQVIWRWIIMTRKRPLKVIQIGTIRKVGCGFLLALSCIICEIKRDIGRKSWFLPRDVASSAALAVMRCPSVFVSVTFVHSVKTNKYIFEFFSTSDSHTILVFPYQTGWRYSNGTPPPNGASSAGGVGRNRHSEPIYGSSMPAVNAVTGQMLSTRSPVDHGHRPEIKLWHIAGISGGVDCGRRWRNVYDKKPQHYAKDNNTAHLTARSDKSVASTRRFVLLKLTTDRHEASRGLFAIAELLVPYPLAFDAPVGIFPSRLLWEN